MAIGKKIMIGIRIHEKEPLDTNFVTKALIVKKTTIPTTSSKTAIGNKVSVTGPFVLNSWTMDKAGAGAVAKAIEPKTSPNHSGI